jgi:hypothetical protein
MLSSIFKVVDDVYSAADREVGGIVDGCSVGMSVGGVIVIVGCWSYSIRHSIVVGAATVIVVCDTFVAIN